MAQLTEMLKGVLEGCVLELLDQGSSYGYEITKQLNELGFVDVVQGTVYTILLRLERNGLVEAVKSPSDMGPPRKNYTLNEGGRTALQRFWETWNHLKSCMDTLREERR